MVFAPCFRHGKISFNAIERSFFGISIIPFSEHPLGCQAMTIRAAEQLELPMDPTEAS